MSLYFIDGATEMPPKVITNGFFPSLTEELESNLMFAGTKERRHCEVDAKASDFLIRATEKLLKKTGVTADEIGVMLDNSTMLDIPFTGSGAAWAYGCGIDPDMVYDIHNSGCTSFVFMAELAQKLLATSDKEYALIGNVQTAAGKIFAEPQNRKKPQSVVPGDGCGVFLVSKSHKEGSGKLVDVVTQLHGEFAEDMYIERPDGLDWWQPSSQMGIIEFSKSKTMRILSRGNRSVPQRIKEVCEKSGTKITDITFFTSNQPNMTFIRNWREFIQLPEDRQQQSYARYGNLFGAAMPINLSEALDGGKIKGGDLVCIAGFSHAGDYSSAMLIQY